MSKDIDWDWSGYLGRSLLDVDTVRARDAVQGRRVLITGAGGSIGSELARHVLQGSPECLILCDCSEYGLYEIHRRLAALPEARTTRIVPLLGDVLQPRLLRRTFSLDRPDLVFHAAAYKHVPLLESNPFAALTNNAVATMVLVRALLEQGECQMVLLSTDKAVQPRSVMGLSKRLAEMAVLSHSTSATPMCAVRLCNVLESSGSVIPLFKEQLERGAAITVTHSEAKRCFITAPEAGSALLTAATARLAGTVLVPRCGEPLRVYDLASYMHRRYRQERGEARKVTAEIVIVGLRTGEKLLEEMVAPFEVLERTLESGACVFASSCPPAHEVESTIGRIEHAVDSGDTEAMFAAIAELVPDYQPPINIPSF